MPEHRNLAAWISRHEPTAAQRAVLERLHYEIRMVEEPRGRYVSPSSIWHNALSACDGALPDLLVVVMNKLWMGYLVQRARRDGAGPVVMMPMKRTEDGRYCWSGEIVKVNGILLQTETWWPR